MIEHEEDIIVQEEEDSGDGWLVSYADMMTLIACFFILMMAFANYDPAGFNKKAKELSKSFNKDKYKSSDLKLTELSEEISRHPTLQKKAKVTVVDSDVYISFSGSVIFDEGSVDIKGSVLPALDTLIDIIRTRDPNYKVVIEGHTDPFEHKKNEFTGSSWELGAMRAARILARFEYFGFSPKKLIAIGKGDSEPTVKNRDKNGKVITQNLRENRKVMIKVIEPKDEKKKLRFGLGLYFNE